MKSPSKSPAVAASLVLVFVIGAMDFAVGYEVSFFLFYFIPVALAAWKTGFKGGACLAVLAAGVWYAADRMAGHSYSSSLIPVWNTGIRCTAFLVIAYGTSKIGFRVQTLTKLLPICAQCKRVRTDQGYWEQVESYVRRNAPFDFSHGICEDCARKLYPEHADAVFGPTKKKAD